MDTTAHPADTYNLGCAAKLGAACMGSVLLRTRLESLLSVSVHSIVLCKVEQRRTKIRFLNFSWSSVTCALCVMHIV